MCRLAQQPSWYLVTTDDRMIPPPLQRLMAERAGSTVAEVAGATRSTSRSANAVAMLIEQAARLAQTVEATP